MQSPWEPCTSLWPRSRRAQQRGRDHCPQWDLLPPLVGISDSRFPKTLMAPTGEGDSPPRGQGGGPKAGRALSQCPLGRTHPLGQGCKGTGTLLPLSSQPPSTPVYLPWGLQTLSSGKTKKNSIPPDTTVLQLTPINRDVVEVWGLSTTCFDPLSPTALPLKQGGLRLSVKTHQEPLPGRSFSLESDLVFPPSQSAPS